MTQEEQNQLVKLNVGCGLRPVRGWINLDINPGPGVDFIWDMDSKEPLPLQENSIDRFMLKHSLEHFRNPLNAMEQLWRIAKPGAKMIVLLPYGTSDSAWEDPTHVRPYFLNSFLYFSQCPYGAADYNYRGDWKTLRRIFRINREKFDANVPEKEMIFTAIRDIRNVVDEFVVELEAVKPAREPGHWPEEREIGFTGCEIELFVPSTDLPDSHKIQ